MEEELKKCLNIHGYISSSENESDIDSKLEFDKQFNTFKPSPLKIEPTKCKIIVIDDDIDCEKETLPEKTYPKLLYSDMLKGFTNSHPNKETPVHLSNRKQEVVSKSDNCCDSHEKYCDQQNLNSICDNNSQLEKYLQSKLIKHGCDQKESCLRNNNNNIENGDQRKRERKRLRTRQQKGHGQLNESCIKLSLNSVPAKEEISIARSTKGNCYYAYEGKNFHKYLSFQNKYYNGYIHNNALLCNKPEKGDSAVITKEKNKILTNTNGQENESSICQSHSPIPAKEDINTIGDIKGNNYYAYEGEHFHTFLQFQNNYYHGYIQNNALFL